MTVIGTLRTWKDQPSFTQRACPRAAFSPREMLRNYAAAGYLRPRAPIDKAQYQTFVADRSDFLPADLVPRGVEAPCCRRHTMAGFGSRQRPGSA
jgi:hypothetical protein